MEKAKQYFQALLETVLSYHYPVFSFQFDFHFYNSIYIELYLKEHWKTSLEKNCFSAWASTLDKGLINKVDMVYLSSVGYGV